MNRTAVSSSNLASVGYDPGNLILEIEFHKGAIYQYFDVPDNIYQGLMQADSKGTYFNSHIRNDYRYAKL